LTEKIYGTIFEQKLINFVTKLKKKTLNIIFNEFSGLEDEVDEGGR